MGEGDKFLSKFRRIPKGKTAEDTTSAFFHLMLICLDAYLTWLCTQHRKLFYKTQQVWRVGRMFYFLFHGHLQRRLRSLNGTVLQ